MRWGCYSCPREDKAYILISLAAWNVIVSLFILHWHPSRFWCCQIWTLQFVHLNINTIYSNSEPELNMFIVILYGKQIYFTMSGRISICFCSKSGQERENYVKIVTNYYLKVEPKLMSSYVQCDKRISAHLPSRSRSLSWSHTGEQRYLSLDNW